MSEGVDEQRVCVLFVFLFACLLACSSGGESERVIIMALAFITGRGWRDQLDRLGVLGAGQDRCSSIPTLIRFCDEG